MTPLTELTGLRLALIALVLSIEAENPGFAEVIRKRLSQFGPAEKVVATLDGEGAVTLDDAREVAFMVVGEAEAFARQERAAAAVPTAGSA